LLSGRDVIAFPAGDPAVAVALPTLRANLWCEGLVAGPSKSEGELPRAPGDVAMIPSGARHKFTNDGPGKSKIVCIHASPTIIGDWLE
jgi:mannose-6-phosphate isomerase-like protein (cupin superfamily)